MQQPQGYVSRVARIRRALLISHDPLPFEQVDNPEEEVNHECE
jgi:hypothetical protein